MNKFSWGEPDKRLVKGDKIMCPHCLKNEAQIDKIYGILPCTKCTSGKSSKVIGKSEKELFDELQTPFWKLIGAKPKPQDVKLESYLKHRGMTYGDWRRERDYHEAKYPSAINKFNEHYKQYGRNNAPLPSFGKND